MGEDAILDGVKKYGPSAGGKAMMDFEYVHGQEALESGLYVTYWSVAKKMECGRIGSKSLCFCGHKYADHDIKATKKKQKTNCGLCKCKFFRFVPQRPEECGMWWLPRRKNFKMSEWKAKCKCGHGHDRHSPVPPLSCKDCGCFDFYCDFACISCDCRWEDHEVLYEFEHDRMMEGKKIGEDYLPLKQNEELHKLVFKTDRKKLPNYNRTKVPRGGVTKAIRGRGGAKPVRARGGINALPGTGSRGRGATNRGGRGGRGGVTRGTGRGRGDGNIGPRRGIPRNRSSNPAGRGRSSRGGFGGVDFGNLDGFGGAGFGGGGNYGNNDVFGSRGGFGRGGMSKDDSFR